MRKPPTGEPYAGEPPVRFGGRGGREPFPTPITSQSADPDTDQIHDCSPGEALNGPEDFEREAPRYGPAGGQE
jgi:hypothetical protein